MIAYIVYAIFWIGVPIGALYFRTKKRIKTGFAIGLGLTSFLLGLILAHSFDEDLPHRFVRTMNEEQYQEAEKVLTWILQTNPDDIIMIDEKSIKNNDKYIEIKKKLEKKFIELAEKNMAIDGIYDFKECSKLVIERDKLHKLQHSLRLVQMVESLGNERPDMKKILVAKIEKGSEILSESKKNCK